jgi:hypothetical protein
MLMLLEWCEPRARIETCCEGTLNRRPAAGSSMIESTLKAEERQRGSVERNLTSDSTRPEIAGLSSLTWMLLAGVSRRVNRGVRRRRF